MFYGSQLAERKDKSLYNFVSEVHMNLLQNIYALIQIVVHQFLLSVT